MQVGLENLNASGSNCSSAMKTVLISGAGIAGPTLVFWLKAAGFQPTLIERAPGLRSGGYVIDFWGLGYDIAERMGLIAEINRVGYKVRELRIVNDRGRRAAGFGTKLFTELTGGRYVTLPRSELSRLLFEKIKDAAEVIFDDEIVCLKEHPDRVGVQLKHSGERQFDLVIGADGLHSTVRKLAFGTPQQFEKNLGYIVAAFEARGYRPRDEDVYLMYGQPGRMVGRFTLRDDQTLFLFVFAADGDPLPSTLDQQKAMLQRKYAAGGWECPSVMAATGSRNRTLFRPRQSDQDEKLVKGAHRTRRRCCLLRLPPGRTRFCIGDGLGLRAGG